MTLEGREAFYNDIAFARDELTELSYTMKAECNRKMRAENPSQDEADISGMLHELPDLIKAESATQTSTTGNWEESGGNGGGGQDTPFGGVPKFQMAPRHPQILMRWPQRSLLTPRTPCNNSQRRPAKTLRCYSRQIPGGGNTELIRIITAESVTLGARPSQA